ncbi:cellulose synthase family protein [Daejeonella oryzae]|uniref:cellulose synthase family protein n=1 Tax=Daejeonella oryzae TaxID=1122943 RepID=UPI001FE0B5E2|nr:cellulose synthase family protein [Daejeonella oryzae]
MQLPLYNEKFVIERLLDAVSKLNYPKEKLEIQVLDDSTDESVLICSNKIKQLQKSGFNIRHIKRANRIGFKAGALQEGLLIAKGDFLAIFDADFIPEPDFLLKALPYFSTPNIGLVQTRWGHINGNQSWLTRAQELGLNGHFIIDQEGRNKSNLFINFNGTAGIWRKSCIVDAGGWQYDTLTEDLDLSYRAQMKGWKLCYCPHIVTPAELPFLLNGVKTQQFRWIKGGIETSKKIITDLWKSEVSLSVKIFGSFHLLSNYVYLFILMSSVLSVPAMFVKNLDPDFDLFFKLNAIFFSVFIINFSYCLTTIWTEKNTLREALREIVQVFPIAILVSLGLSYHNTTAIFQGVIGKKTSFIRTPKFSIDTGKNALISNQYLSKKSIFKELPEIILFIYFLFAVFAGIYFMDFGFLPYHLIMLSGFGLILYYAFSQSKLKTE